VYSVVKSLTSLNKDLAKEKIKALKYLTKRTTWSIGSDAEVRLPLFKKKKQINYFDPVSPPPPVAQN
jgi:hypothetical protein